MDGITCDDPTRPPARPRGRRRRIYFGLMSAGILGCPAMVVALHLGNLPTAATAKPQPCCASPSSAAPLVGGTPSTTRPTGTAPNADGTPLPGRAAGLTSTGHLYSAWATMDRRTEAITGSSNLEATNSTESMVKAWIAGDDLRLLEAADIPPDGHELRILRRMIRDSDDNAAETIYRRNGSDRVIQRLIRMCRLTDTKVYHAWWSLTEMSPRDAVRMGHCIADGRAAGPKWTHWLLNEMQSVRGEGRFGIVAAFPVEAAKTLAIKNGWTLHDAGTRWHVNCLAIAPDWILAVAIRFPASVGGLAFGARFCADVARHVIGPIP
jgi:hypothetical protein